MEEGAVDDGSSRLLAHQAWSKVHNGNRHPSVLSKIRFVTRDQSVVEEAKGGGLVCSIEFQFFGFGNGAHPQKMCRSSQSEDETRRADGSHLSVRCSSLAGSVELKSMIPS